MRFFLLLSKMQFLICFIIFWAKANCAASDTTTLTAICTCGSETLNGCFTDEFCWSTGDSPSCNNHALCVPDDENAITTNNCQCASDSTTAECNIDSFCWSDQTCNDHALCVPHDENAIATNACQCASDSTTAECAIDSFCLIGNVCSTVGNNYKNFSFYFRTRGFVFLKRK